MRPNANTGDKKQLVCFATSGDPKAIRKGALGRVGWAAFYPWQETLVADGFYSDGPEAS